MNKIMNENTIFSTDWVPAFNSLIEIKFYYARKGEQIFVAVAHKTKGCGFDLLPTSLNSSVIKEYQEPLDTSLDAENKIKSWLNTSNAEDSK